MDDHRLSLRQRLMLKLSIDSFSTTKNISALTLSCIKMDRGNPTRENSFQISSIFQHICNIVDQESNFCFGSGPPWPKSWICTCLLGTPKHCRQAFAGPGILHGQTSFNGQNSLQANVFRAHHLLLSLRMVTSLPLKKAWSSIGAPVVLRATGPLV